ncbi:MAG: BamA/TamA family outer membrane protein [Gammaproteobacteria bacterium]|nr:BamA/TamA family outer membrane protein [Gammaproteobacteria bacterium]
MRMLPVILLVPVLILSWPASALEAYTAPVADSAIITDIVITGNEVTRPEIILQEMLLGVGDPPNAGLIERSTQAIRDLGLFSSVTVNVRSVDDDVELIIDVKEKLFLLPVPRLNRNADGDIKYGAQLRWNNVAGLNQTIRMTLDRTEYSDNTQNDRDEFRIDYDYPRIRQTLYNVDLKYSIEHSEQEATSDLGVLSVFDEETTESRLRISRWWTRSGATRGWLSGFGAARTESDYEYISGDPDVLVDRTMVSLLGSLSYHQLHETEFSRFGYEFGYDVSQSLETIGADETATTSEIFVRDYRPVSDTPHRNINTQWRVGVSSLDGNKTYDLGGSSRLRGYDRGSITGNAFFLANIQYLAPWPGYPAFRYVVFTDIGNAYKNARYIDLGDVRASVGLGFRWKLQSFVKTYLRLDCAYAFDTDETKVYGATVAMF